MSEAAPEIPTVAEAGVPGYSFYGWYCMLAPAKTPRNIVSALNGTVVSAMQSPEIRDRLAAEGSTVVGSSADELGVHIRTEIAKLTKLLEPIIIMAMGSTVAGLMLAIYLPMFEMAGKVK